MYKHYIAFSLLAGLVVCSSLCNAQEPKLESIEWSDVWVVNADKTEEVRVLLVGDSIVKGYYGSVEKALPENTSCARYATSLFLSNPDYLAEITLLLNRYHFDVIHINNGLHGWDYSEKEYKNGLQKLVAALKQYAPKATLIWCMTTPLRASQDISRIDSKRNDRVIERNRIAAEIMKENKIPVNDLYAAMIDHPEYFSDDGVHYNNKGRGIQGKQIGSMIETYLRTDTFSENDKK